MKIIYKESFINDLKKLKNNPIYERIIDIAFNILPTIESLNLIKNYKKLKGYSDKARIKVKDYRIGLQINADNIEIVRVLHRKDIYKKFP